MPVAEECDMSRGANSNPYPDLDLPNQQKPEQQPGTGEDKGDAGDVSLGKGQVQFEMPGKVKLYDGPVGPFEPA